MTVNTSILVPDIGCSSTLLPTYGDIAISLKSLASLPTRLTLLGLPDIANQIKNSLSSIQSALGGFPVSIANPIFQNIQVLEYEWELRARSIVNEYKLYFLQKILNIISAIPGLSNIFQIPVPFLGTVDIVNLFTDASYVASLKAMIANNIQGALAAVGSFLSKSYTGIYGLIVKEFNVQEIWSWFVMEMTNIGTNVLNGAFGFLINKFNSIWRTLHLPGLPALVTVDIEALIQSAVDSVSTALDPASYRNALINALNNISIFGFNLQTLLGGTFTDFVESAEMKINRLISAAKDFAVKWPLYLQELWMQAVTAFFRAVPALRPLLPFIPFTFCDFLNVIGFPTSFSGIIPATLPVEPGQL